MNVVMVNGSHILNAVFTRPWLADLICRSVQSTSTTDGPHLGQWWVSVIMFQTITGGLLIVLHTENLESVNDIIISTVCLC